MFEKILLIWFAVGFIGGFLSWQSFKDERDYPIPFYIKSIWIVLAIPTGIFAWSDIWKSKNINKLINRALLQIGIFLQMITGLRFELKTDIQPKLIQIPTEYLPGFNKRLLRKNKWNKPRDFWKK